MIDWQHLLYGLIYRLALLLLPIATFFSSKVRKGVELRKNSPWLAVPAGLKPIWFHCSSGEFEYAKPVIAELKKRNPNIAILVTYFSPSAHPIIQKFSQVDYFCAAPWDTAKCMREFLVHIQPRYLLIARTDTWPEMLIQTKMAEIPIAIFSTTLSSSSGRLMTGVKGYFSKLLAKAHIFTVSDDDSFVAKNLFHLTQVSRIGDTRYDQVISRLQNVNKAKWFNNDRPTIIAGSTWPEDENVLLEVIAETHQDWNWIIVPHEVHAEHISRLKNDFTRLNLKTRLDTEGDPSTNDIFIVATHGRLAEAYMSAQVAFVGGSFKQKVHSVMEPLAAGCLVVVGPKYQNNREAIQFSKVSTVDNLPSVRSVRSSRDFIDYLSQVLQSHRSKSSLFTETAQDIKRKIESQTGASKLLADHIEKTLQF